ncbi:hypothetical protein MHYP_G00351370 [Metynnis hypsauchen]
MVWPCPPSGCVPFRLVLPYKPRLRVDPQSSVYTGDTVTLSCEPQYQSTDWSFFWKKDSQYIKQHHQQSPYSITVSHPGETDYKCIALTRDYQPEDSDPVRITVRVKVKPTITSNHEGAALTGNTVTLYCKLHQSAGWTFYWSKHTQNSEKETITNVYTISSVSLSDGGQYWCKAGRGNPVYYTHYSDALWVNVTGVSRSGPPVSALSLLSSLMAVSPYLLVSIVLGVKCYRARAGPDEENRT